MDAEDLGSRRYRWLVEQLVAESKGNKSKAAKRLGVTDAFVSYVLRDADDPAYREAKGDAITKAMDHLGIDSRYFYDARVSDTSPYAAHVRWRTEPDAKMPAAWDEFLVKHAPRLDLDGDETAWLREIRTHRATAESYLQAIILRRGGLAPEDAAESARFTAESAEIGAGLGVPRIDPSR